MVKNVRAVLDEDEHNKMIHVKADRTWLDVLRRGIDSIKAYPEDEGWKEHIELLSGEVKA